MLDLSEKVVAAQGGSSDAFDDLVRATYDDTYLLALRLTGNHHDAHDVAQDTYLRAFRGLGRFRRDANFATWLFRITTNCASNLRSRRKRNETVELLDHHVAQADRFAIDPEANVEALDLRAALRVALLKLPAKLREVVVLRDMYDLSHQSIAGALGISESAAKVRLHRARRKLSEELFASSLDIEVSAAEVTAGEASAGEVSAGTTATDAHGVAERVQVSAPEAAA